MLTEEKDEVEELVITLTSDQKAERLDKYLAGKFLQSRTYFQFLIEQGAVLLNGLVPKKRTLIKAFDSLSIQFIDSEELNLEPENIPLSILFEDAHLIAVDKPAGMVVHPGAGNWKGTFVNALLFHCQKASHSLEGVGLEKQRPGIIHRLDKDTSGVLLAAKSPFAHQMVSKQFAEREVCKYYLAICYGNPGKGTVNAPIGRNPNHRQSMAIVEKGKMAITHYETVAASKELSLLKIKLETGRTHQIRVHMRYLGTPLIGDALYGNASINKKYGISRQMLHAESLQIAHPISEEKLFFSAKIPSDMAQLIEKEKLIAP